MYIIYIYCIYIYCVYIYKCIHLHIIQIHTHIHTYTHTHIHTYTHTHTYTHIHTHTHIHTYTHTHIQTYISACMHTYNTIQYNLIQYIQYIRDVTWRDVTLLYVTLRYVLLHYSTLHYSTVHYIHYIQTDRRTDGRTAGPMDRQTDIHTYMTQVGGFKVRWSHCQVLTMCRHYREKLLLVTREVDALRRDQALQMPLVGRSNGFRYCKHILWQWQKHNGICIYIYIHTHTPDNGAPRNGWAAPKMTKSRFEFWLPNELV